LYLLVNAKKMGEFLEDEVGEKGKIGTDRAAPYTYFG
jgi:hypothetical protein